ncbi:putative HAD family hydrolase [Candidatus Termititenax aidoneus]|uniref:HAD family hydrolase n=1 Tax=Termititenax aidoneus TaxID=2218524 RepID=A0A388TA84_TERA1|nr:putative HAD family hydrolase [Candidatus Termititenax aidoneus]
MPLTLQETLREFLTPEEYLDDIVALNLQSLAARGVKLLLIDADNAVLPPDSAEPSLRMIYWFEQLKTYPFQTVLISGSLDRARLARISAVLQTPVYYALLKPLLSGFKAVLAEYGVRPAECALAGGALWSDVLPAKFLGFYAVLVKNCDQPVVIEQRAGLLRRTRAAFLEKLIQRQV